MTSMSKRPFAILNMGILSFLVTGSHAQPLSVQPPFLHGVVIGPEGRPIAGALVMARPQTDPLTVPPCSTRSDASGAFRVALRQLAPHTVRIEAQGLAARTFNAVHPSKSLTAILDRGGSIEGTVRDGADGRPLSGMRVETREYFGVLPIWEPRAGVIDAVTDDRGRFRLVGVGPGLHVVSAAGPAYAHTDKESVRPGDHVELHLFPGASLSGRIVSPQGAVEGAIVSVESEMPLVRHSAVAITDGAGWYDLFGLPAGTYRIVARHRNYAPSIVRGIRVGVGSASLANPISVAPGATVIGRLVAGPLATPLQGLASVVQSDGQAIPPTLTALLRKESDPEGYFRIEGVPAGSLTLTFSAVGYTLGSVEVEVPSRTELLDLGAVYVDSGLSIRGRVRDTAGRGIIAQLRGIRGAHDEMWLAEVQTAPDGSFVLAGLEPGEYSLTISAPGFGPAAMRTEAGSDAVDIVLLPAGTVTGHVVDHADAPIGSFSVRISPTRRAPDMNTRPRREPFNTTDGRFSLTDVGEGEYVVEVFAPLYSTATFSNVEVSSDATADLGRIRLDTAGTVKGRVADSNDVPVAGVSILVRSMRDARTASDVSNDDGTFEVQGSPTGIVELIANHADYAQARVSGLAVTPAKGPTVTAITMNPGGDIEGWVRHRDGTGIAGAHVQVRPVDAPGHAFVTPANLTSTQGGSATTSPDGSFTVARVAPGRAQITVLLPDHASTRALTRDVAVSNAATTTVNITVSELLVTGRVTRGGQPAPGMRISLSSPTTFVLGQPDAGPMYMMAITRADGRYSMIVEEPGEYIVRVESVDGVVKYPSRRVVIPDTEEFDLILDFATQRVAGIVLDAETERPIPHVTVFAQPTNAQEQGGWAKAESGADGRFYMELERREYRLRGLAEGYSGEVTLKVGTGTSLPRLLLTREDQGG